ncbi:methyltransferase domain-containing protein [Actinomadura algeriensis]|uniref:Protein-L-isoaspartate O-methyltransferase n=1 Tax=Actinomadura algeriensis TaxID=1679523 RepID=A0ABR9JPE1_9ACTN|nr:protein-L-isoaspartate(D-aspartate) O-methyltransferase [Actinomadura algeriensis]MBE1532289.1 hypothetical protein [Actinomadura algeriensis]
MTTLDLVTHSPDGESRGLAFRVGDIFPMDPNLDLASEIDARATEARPWGLRFLVPSRGTGTGYTAAVLSVLVGAANVTSVEVDADVAARAVANLAAAGFDPLVVVGDGTDGHAGRAPYDRVHATCAVARVPYAWVEQTRPGGVIVAPWQPIPGYGWRLRLTCLGSRAIGRFHGTAGYMMSRGQRDVGRWNPHHYADASTTWTRLDPRTVGRAGPGFVLTVLGRCPGLGMFSMENDDGSFSLLMFERGAPDGSWASCDWEPGGTDYEVVQYGDRSLWDEVAGAFGWWVRHDRPDVDRFGLTVTPDGERLWLDEPVRGL